MASVTEKLNFLFNLILTNLNIILKLILDSIIRKLISMFRTTWICESTFSNMNFMKSKYRSIFPDENLMFKLRDMLISIKYTLDSDDLVENRK